jgi:glycosyltransferase 2 family protein
VLGCAVSVLAIYFLLQQVSIEQLKQALGAAQPLGIVLVVMTVMGSLVTRAARWQVFFLPDRRLPFDRLFGTLAISYMASTFLPLRAGELVRAVFLGNREGVGVPRVVGTILLEKLFDFLAIGVLLALLLAMPDPAHPLPDLARAAGVTIASVILVGFGFVVALAVLRAPTLRLVGLLEARLPLGLGKRLRLEQTARQFAEGTDSLREPRLWALLLMWTAVTWVFSLGSSWAGALALGVAPTLQMLLLLTVLTSTGQAVPSSPGYVGVYHAAATVALTTFGVDTTTALAIAVVTHAFSYGSLVVVGLIALWMGGYTFGDVLSGIRGQGRQQLVGDERSVPGGVQGRAGASPAIAPEPPVGVPTSDR